MDSDDTVSFEPALSVSSEHSGIFRGSYCSGISYGSFLEASDRQSGADYIVSRQRAGFDTVCYGYFNEDGVYEFRAVEYSYRLCVFELLHDYVFLLCGADDCSVSCDYKTSDRTNYRFNVFTKNDVGGGGENVGLGAGDIINTGNEHYGVHLGPFCLARLLAIM